MKKGIVLVNILLIAVFVLSGCEGFTLPGFPTPTPLPPPHAEDATWQFTILSLQKTREPAELSCSDCGSTISNEPIHLQKGYMYLKATAVVANRAAEAKEIPVFDIGVSQLDGMVDCGGVTYDGSDYCLLAGVTRGGKTYVNHDIESSDFRQAITFAPNAPGGETVEFYFIVRVSAKPQEFYFDDLPALDVHRMKITTG